MLAHLSIRDIVLIEQLEIDFQAGLTVLTGETGGGKSILLDALSLALGARGDGDLVRAGRGQGAVSAMFVLANDHQAVRRLAEQGLVAVGNANGAAVTELGLRRVQSADGPTRAFINDTPVSVTLLREIGRTLVEIHGQHDDRALVEADAHRSLLDAFGGHRRDRGEVARAWADWRQAEEEMSALEARVGAAAREAEYLRASVEELTTLAPQAGEETTLANRRATMMRAERIAEDLNEANEVLAGRDSPVPLLAGLAKRLARKAEQAPGLLEATIAKIDAGVDALHAAQSELETAVRQAEFDPQELEAAETRLFALRAASRKFGVPVDELSAFAEKLAAQLGELDDGEARLAQMREQATVRRDDYMRLAQALSAKRTQAAAGLTQAVETEFPSLRLDDAGFHVRLESSPEQAGQSGLDTVAFWVRTNPGTKPGPILKVASGGELARFLLALKVALADKGSAPTLVFDEIDTGIGGAVADAMGRRLARLAADVQVLSVTHAPQVAARADHHLVISKTDDGARERVLKTEVAVVDAEQRRDEIARMLAGATITVEARAAAERLIDQPGE